MEASGRRSHSSVQSNARARGSRHGPLEWTPQMLPLPFSPLEDLLQQHISLNGHLNGSTPPRPLPSLFSLSSRTRNLDIFYTYKAGLFTGPYCKAYRCSSNVVFSAYMYQVISYGL